MTEPIHFIHPSLWERLSELEPEEVCRRAMVGLEGDAYRVSFLKEVYAVDPKARTFLPLQEGPEPSPELKVAVINYLIGAKEIPPKGKWVLPKDLSGGRGFSASHTFPVEPILEQYGSDPEGFLRKGISLGAEREAFGDASLKFPALPRIPVLFVLWRGDEEFPPRINVLLDVTATEHMQVDALYGLVIEVCRRLC